MRKDDTNSVLNKVKSAIPSLFNSQEVSDKAIMFAENFPKISNLDDSGISLPVFFSRTNLKRHNISLTLKLVQKVTTSLALLKVFGPDFIPVVILKNCKPELLYMLAELFNMCLMEFFFCYCWKVSSVVPVFKNFGEVNGYKLPPVSLLSLVCKVY